MLLGKGNTETAQRWGCGERLERCWLEGTESLNPARVLGPVGTWPHTEQGCPCPCC